MRVYVDIDNFKAKDIHELYVYAITNDRKAITVGGDMMVWCADCKEVKMNKLLDGKAESEE